MGPCPHCEKQPALLIRTSVLRPARRASARRNLTCASTSPRVGQSSPLVHTNTCVLYWPIKLSLGPRSGGPSGRRLGGLSLRDEPIHFLAHRLHDVLLGHLPDDLAVLEDEPDAAAAGDADVGDARLAGTVD